MIQFSHYLSTTKLGTPIFVVGTPLASSVGHTLDTLWMVLAAVVPIFNALYLMFIAKTPNVHFTVSG